MKYLKTSYILTIARHLTLCLQQIVETDKQIWNTKRSIANDKIIPIRLSAESSGMEAGEECCIPVGYGSVLGLLQYSWFVKDFRVLLDYSIQMYSWDTKLHMRHLQNLITHSNSKGTYGKLKNDLKTCRLNFIRKNARLCTWTATNQITHVP